MKYTKSIVIAAIAILAIVLLFYFSGKFFPQKENGSSDSNMNKEIVTENGLKIQDIKTGDGGEAENGNTVTAHYTGMLLDGTKFDSSLDRGTPFSFQLGSGQVIAGWDRGVLGMKAGGKRKLTIPPDLAYGEQGIPGAIPPNATLIFEIELLSVQ